MTKRGLLLWVVTVALLTTSVPGWAQTGGGAKAPSGPKAGNITALLPVAKIVRGAGKQAVTAEAKKGDQLVWNDLIKTEKGGRARITLVDQSILSLGSQAELRIVKHDARTQQTALQMAYGRVRAQVANITRDGGSFEMRTPTAVAGVIGTDFGVDSSSVGGDTFVCLTGAVQIKNSDATVQGSVQCSAGQTTTVQPGKPPTTPTPATPQQLQQLIEDTEPAIIASISPAAALPGTTFDTTIAGQNMAQVNSVTVSGSGVNATIKSAAATGVQIHVVVDQTAAAGPRTITLAKAAGAASATVFTVLGTPTGDPKTAYIQTLQQLTQAGVAGLGGFLTGAQQSADQVSTQVTNANLNLPKPLDLSPFASSLNSQYGVLQNALQSQNTAIQNAAQNAENQFQTSYQAAYQALLQRDPTGTPDSTFNTAVNAAFQSANSTLQSAISGAQSSLNGNVQTYGTSLSDLQQSWIQNINTAFTAQLPGPTPRVNALERTVELGATASFDASGSQAGQGASVVSTQWTLCSPGYKPNGYGMPLDPSTTACTGIAGFASTQSQFDIATCSLNPGDYYARLLLTDSNNKTTPMDVKLTVLAPNYGTPTQEVRALADAYSNLSLSDFTKQFDQSAFSGYNSLYLNISKLMSHSAPDGLSSMNINIISSQDTVNCNDAVTRATWQQNYSFITNAGVVFKQEEQLQVTMRRNPGTGWLITNFSGDNGTVQGVPPGPAVVDTSAPDLSVATVTVDGMPAISVSTISPGSHTFGVTVLNNGSAGFAGANWHTVFSATDSTGKTITPTDVLLTNTSIAAGTTSSLITGALTVPADPDGAVITVTVTPNTGCVNVAANQEKSCANNSQTFKFTVQNNTITLQNVTPSLTISPGGTAGTVSMDVSSTYYPVQVCAPLVNGIVVTASNGGIKTGGTPTSPTCKSVATATTGLTFTIAAAFGTPIGTQSLLFTASNNGNPSTGVPPATQTATVSLTVALPDLQVGSGISIPSALQMGSTTTVLAVPVTNTGNAAAAAGWNVVVTINGSQAGTATMVNPIPAGQTANVNVNLTVPVVGTPPQNLPSTPAVVTLNANQAIQESNTSNNSFTGSTTLVDFAITTAASGTQTAVFGRSFTLTAANVSASPYPLPLTIGYSGLTAGLTGTASIPANTSLPITITGTPTATGSTNVTLTGTVAGVSHNASATISINTLSEIAVSQTATPALVAGDPSQLLTVSVTGGIYPVTLCVALPTGITTTAGTITGNQSCQTIAAAGSVSWDFAAGFTAATGSLNTTITATDGGFSAITPAGNVLKQVNYSVASNANFVITGAAWVGHSAPYTGAKALQVGEQAQLQVTVANQGNGSPSGNITVNASCGNLQFCSTPLTGTVAAPAAGSSTTVTLNTNGINLPVASYPGTATVSTTIPGAVVGPTASLNFDVVDFAVSPVTYSPQQNLPINGSATLSFTITESLPSGSPFLLNVIPVADPNLTYSCPPSSSGVVNCTVTIASTAPAGVSSATINVTNYGVAKSNVFPTNYYTASLMAQNLFVNDPANPLVIPIAPGAGVPNVYPDIQFKMVGNYVGGLANLQATNPTGCGNFSDTFLPTTALPGDLLDLPIYAATGNTCAPASLIKLQGQIPNTNPATTADLFPLYVTPKGLAQLQASAVVSATGRDFTAQPLLAGEPADLAVTVKNVGSGPSTGNEAVQISLNGAQVGQGTLTSPIAANGQAVATVHIVAPDVPADATFGPTANLTAHVVLDTQGDLAPGTGDFFTSINVSNWSIGVTGAGSSDGNALHLNVISPTSGTTTVAINPLASGTFNPNLTLPLVLGQYSSGQLNPSGLSPATVTSSAGSTVTVSLQNGMTPLTGYYFAQVIAQMKDGATVTTQRQATIHVYSVNDSANSPATIALASDRSNIAGCVVGQGCGTPNSSVQINGPLPEAFNLTATVAFCSSGPCVGPVDISFTDTFATVTTPQIGTVQVTSPGNTLAVRVRAADNPDGSINTGAASVITSVSAIQAPFAGAHQPTPDPVGNNQFTMAFNVGDLFISTSPCYAVQPGNPTPVNVGVTLTAYSGFNVPSVAWEWEDANHVLVSGSPLAFSQSSSTSNLSGTNYPLPTFTVTNPGTGVDGIQTYYFAVTVSNALATATKYFPVQFDLSQSQTFCPAAGAARGSAGGTIIRGSWSKSALSASARGIARASGKLPDVRISAADVSFTPSMPKNGDTVNVRFRISNVGDTDATNVPVALQVNGLTVVSDTFNVAPGKTTLGALVWNNAKIPAAAAPPPGTLVRATRGSRDGAPAAASIATTLQAAVVIDPAQTMKQKTTLQKSAALAHLTLHDGGVTTATLTATLNQQRVVLELGEGGCAGLRFNLGAGGCGSADVTVNVEDLAKGTYKLEAAKGIADLGVNNTQYAGASFGPSVLGQNGHTYAVQLAGGKVGLLTMNAVRNPDQLSEAAKRVFRGPAAKVIRKLGDGTNAPEPQTTTKDSKVYFDIQYQGQ